MIFELECTRSCLLARLCPDPLEELTVLPNPLAEFGKGVQGQKRNIQGMVDNGGKKGQGCIPAFCFSNFQFWNPQHSIVAV